VYRQNTRAADLTYTIQTTTDLVAWSDLVPDGQTVVDEILNADPDGDGRAVLKLTRIKVAAGEPRRFLRLHVTK
jgi:hypothetical protein